jgi:ketosteroid isomerase-like protein
MMPEESMTPDLEELVRRLVDALSRRDVDRLMKFFAPEAVWEALGVGDERLRGLTAIRGMLEDWLGSYEDYQMDVEELVDLGNGVVFSVAIHKARPINSSAFVEWRQGFVVLMDDRLIGHAISYADIDQARAAAERLAEERGWAMPDESTTPDLAAARRSTEAFNRRDFDTALAVLAPDSVWDFSSIGMGVFEGREAIRGFCEDWLGTYEDYEQVTEELRDLGNGVIFGVSHQGGRPRGSSGLVALRYAGVGTWRDGLLELLTLYLDIDEARAAAERLVEQRG